MCTVFLTTTEMCRGVYTHTHTQTCMHTVRQCRREDEYTRAIKGVDHLKLQHTCTHTHLYMCTTVIKAEIHLH